jgi:NifB/MoaA-like Fe-S oxidoreductase
MARGLIERVHRWQKEFAGELGRRLVFAADEMYLSTGMSLPGRAQYEGSPQLGNGIGCARQFLDGVRRIRPPKLRRRASVTLVTGEMAAGLVEELAVKLNAGDVRAEVCVVPNGLLGRSVTTAGLLAGRDVARALRRRKVADLMIMAGTAVREGDGFIDGMTLEELSEQAGAPVVAATTPAEATAAVRRFDRGRAVR